MNSALTVFAKEIREMLRDRRVLATAVVSPFAAVAIGLAGFALMASDIEEATEPVRASASPSLSKEHDAISIGIVGQGDHLIELLRKHFPNEKVSRVYHFLPLPSAQEAQMALERGDCDVALLLNGNVDSHLRNEKPARVTLLSRPDSPRSANAMAVVAASLENLDRTLVEKRLETRGMDPQIADAIEVSVRQTASTGSSGVREPLVLALFLPYLLVLASFFGGVPTAFDTVAGEKERGTLETALVSPVRRADLVTGKFLSVFAACLMAGVSAVTGVVLAAYSGIPSLRPILGEDFSWLPILTSLVVLVPLGVFFASILLLVSCYARNQREAQTYLMPLSLAVMLPAMYSIFAGFGSVPSHFLAALTPVYNCTALIRLQIEGGAPVSFVLTTLLSTSILAVASLLVVSRTFHRESVLLRL